MHFGGCKLCLNALSLAVGCLTASLWGDSGLAFSVRRVPEGRGAWVTVSQPGMQQSWAGNTTWGPRLVPSILPLTLAPGALSSPETGRRGKWICTTIFLAAHFGNHLWPVIDRDDTKIGTWKSQTCWVIRWWNCSFLSACCFPTSHFCFSGLELGTSPQYTPSSAWVGLGDQVPLLGGGGG